MTKRKPQMTPAERIEMLQTEVDQLRCRLSVEADRRMRLEREILELSDLVRAQARVMLNPGLAIAERELPF